MSNYDLMMQAIKLRSKPDQPAMSLLEIADVLQHSGNTVAYCALIWHIHHFSEEAANAKTRECVGPVQ